MNTLLITLQAAGGSAFQQIIPIALIMIVFYFFMIRPQTKKQKELN
jgi:preprotein translocase subunit YajC